eukprot:5168759-Pleurochrysis_carterae.AAC.4
MDANSLRLSYACKSEAGTNNSHTATAQLGHCTIERGVSAEIALACIGTRVCFTLWTKERYKPSERLRDRRNVSHLKLRVKERRLPRSVIIRSQPKDSYHHEGNVDAGLLSSAASAGVYAADGNTELAFGAIGTKNKGRRPRRMHHKKTSICCIGKPLAQPFG